MTYNVQIKVMPLKDLLDPQGKAVMGGLKNLGLNAVEDVRIGKHITLQIDADSEDAAKALADQASKKLLATGTCPWTGNFPISDSSFSYAS